MMNNNILKRVLFGTVVALSLASCNYLDVSDELGGISSFENIFNNVDRTKKWYGQIFADRPDYSNVWGATNAMGNAWTGYADEIYTREHLKYGKYSNWNSSLSHNHRWSRLYASIRQANIFLEMAHPIDGEGGSDAQKITEDEMRVYKANARFMRAVYHYYLFEMYGPIPIVDKSYTLDNLPDLERNSVTEVVNWLDAEFEACMQDMYQESYFDNDQMRGVPTKGAAMAYRAKATVKDMEFIQFHPTALFHPGETHPAYLITEAMRGYGGILKLPNGEEFMQKYDKRLSLAPRDIVARAIDHEMKIHGLDHVCLDVTYKDPEETKKHFPNIYKKCLSIGIDITKDYIPVAPCAHYLCGGIKVDENACSSIHRLYAVGECSCTGLHGGNRLASNSLIEAVVYAKAAADHSLAHVDEYDFNEKVPEWNDTGTMTNEEKVLIAQDVKEVGQTMSNYVGIVRSNLRLHRAWTRLDLLYEETEELFKRVKATRDICELRNMINVGYLITRMAIERKESRGLHYTVDYPKHAYDQK